MADTQIRKSEVSSVLDMFANLSEKKQQILFGFALGLEAYPKVDPVSETSPKQDAS